MSERVFERATHIVNRVLDQEPCADLAEHVARGGGKGLQQARAIGAVRTIDVVERSGLRGRGGAGFPTGVKWRTVARAATSARPTPVVVNAAEGEPGSFKDRELLRRNPYRVIEGALIAAVAVGAGEAVVAMKASFEHELSRVESAIGEMEQRGLAATGSRLPWCAGPAPTCSARRPRCSRSSKVVNRSRGSPRRTAVVSTPPTRRHGAVGGDRRARRPGRHRRATGTWSTTSRRSPTSPAILAHGSTGSESWGLPQSPGTIVCTVTGHTRRHGVAEVPMGTPLAAIIDEIGGGARRGAHARRGDLGCRQRVRPGGAVRHAGGLRGDGRRSARASARAASSSSTTRCDLVAAAHAVARFLAVESCGQCEPCKLDGLAIADHLDAIRNSKATDDDLDAVRDKVETVDRGARCALAQQQRRVVTSALALFPDCVDRHLAGDLPAATCDLMLPIVDLVEGQAILDTSHADKQPDWTYEPTWSGASPVDVLADQPVHVERPAIREAPTEPAGASVPDELSDPFREVLAGHRRIRDAAQRAASAADDPAAAVDAIAALGDELRQHDDLGERVLYPLLDRHLGGAGDESSAGPRADLRDAIEQADRIAGDGSPAPDDVHDLIAIAEAHCDTEERTVLPLLRRRLDPAQLDELRDALAEAAHESDD